MRTSKISRDTAKLIDASSSPLSPAPRRSTRASLSRLAQGPHKNESSQEHSDIEDAVPQKKRKRETARTPKKESPRKTVTVKTEAENIVTFSPLKERKVRKPARKITDGETGEVRIQAPSDWAEVYAVVKEMRTTGLARNAAVDSMGCERLAQETVSPKVKRYHTLTALMLSSQTKDTTNAVAMGRLQNELPAYKDTAPIGLNLENILAVDPGLLNKLIW